MITGRSPAILIAGREKSCPRTTIGRLSRIDSRPIAVVQVSGQPPDLRRNCRVAL